jgi:predicted RND superfamily exporter protein
VHAAITSAQQFVDSHPVEGVTARFAGGIIGTTAAANQEVEESELLQTVLIIVVCMLSVLVTYRSFMAALLVFVVLALAVLINRAYMGFRGIGLNVNTLPVTSVGVGLIAFVPKCVIAPSTMRSGSVFRPPVRPCCLPP